MYFEWFVAKRYLWSKRRHPFVGVTATLSVLGIAVGVAALIVVLAVMNGFDDDLRSRIIGMNSHLVVNKEGVFGDYAVVEKELKKENFVAGVSPFVEGQALVQSPQAVTGVLVRGIDPASERTVSNFFGNLSKGTLSDKENGVVVGSELAKRFRLNVGSKVSVLTQDLEKPASLSVEGIFSSGLYEYDANLIFTNLKTARALFAMENSVSGLSVALKDPDRAMQAKRRIQARWGFPYDTRTWMEMNKTLFGALKLEKLVMFLILALIILVACLNIAGSLTILVIDKTRDIGVLKAIGATPSSLVRIFSLDGILIGLGGAGAGGAIGITLCAILKKYNFVQLPREIYYVDHLPVKVQAPDTLTVLLVAVALSLFSAFYPAWMAGRLDPVKALRYE